MAEQDFLVFDPNSVNIESQTTYVADSSRTNGISSGIMSSALYNKTMRQATVMASVIGQFITGQIGATVIDDGTTATILANFILALQSTPLIGGAVYFTTAGTNTWVVPFNVVSVWAEVWGAGGGSTGATGGSGGSGGYVAGFLTVTPGATMTFTVGAGGLGNATITSSTAGGASTFGSFTAGGGGSTGTAGGLAGHGGTATGGTINIIGGCGTDIDGTTGGFGNISANGGNAPRGGQGGNIDIIGTSLPPTQPGGGAGANATNAAYFQNGAAGAVLLTW